MSQQVKIVFPIDFSQFSEIAFETAQYLAKVYEGELFILHVLEAPVGPARLLGGFNESDARKEATKMIEEYFAKHGDDSIPFTPVVKVGKAHRQIVKAATELNANAVVMGTHGASGFQELFAGSNASRVISHAPCPVITIRQEPDHLDYKKILVPLDLTRETGEKLKLSVEFAEVFGGELVVMSVLQNEDPEVKKRLNKRLKMAVDYVRKHNVMVSSSLIVSKDSLSDTVTKYGEEIGADLIVIMTQQEKAWRESILGTQATRVVNHSNIPVLSIKPSREYKESSFASPIFS